MSTSSGEHSEYGGEPGLIQPDLGDGLLPDKAEAAGLGHAATEARAADRRGVQDAAMVVRYAGLKEAHGEIVESATVVDPDTGVATLFQYDEEIARSELVNGENKR